MAYSQENLDRRKGVIDGQKRLIEFLDADKFNRLVHLFDEKVDNNADGEKHIIKFIQKERQSRGLSDDGVTMYSMVYGECVNNSTLHVNIVKDKIDYIHLSIHLSPIKLIPKDQGIIHFVKDIYLNLFKFTKSQKRPLYTLVHVDQPPHKPNSLHFFRTDGDRTNVDKSKGDYDADLAIEMDVILAVMNRLFDEDDKEYYIGSPDIIYPIHKRTENVLVNVNRPNVIPKRRNKGKMLLPPFQPTNHIMTIPKRKYTAKVRKVYGNQSINQKSMRKTLYRKKKVTK